MSRSTTSHADETLLRSALTTLNLEGRRCIRVASHTSELCLRLHRSDADSTTFVIDTNFRYAAPPTATGNRQPTMSDARKPAAPQREATTQMSESVSPVDENQRIQTGSTPTVRATIQQTATAVKTKRRVSRSRDRAIVAKATLATLPLRCFQLSVSLRLVDTHLSIRTFSVTHFISKLFPLKMDRKVQLLFFFHFLLFLCYYMYISLCHFGE